MNMNPNNPAPLDLRPWKDLSAAWGVIRTSCAQIASDDSRPPYQASRMAAWVGALVEHWRLRLIEDPFQALSMASYAQGPLSSALCGGRSWSLLHSWDARNLAMYQKWLPPMVSLIRTARLSPLWRFKADKSTKIVLSLSTRLNPQAHSRLNPQAHSWQDAVAEVLLRGPYEEDIVIRIGEFKPENPPEPGWGLDPLLQWGGIEAPPWQARPPSSGGALKEYVRWHGGGLSSPLVSLEQDPAWDLPPAWKLSWSTAPHGEVARWQGAAPRLKDHHGRKDHHGSQ